MVGFLFHCMSVEGQNIYSTYCTFAAFGDNFDVASALNWIVVINGAIPLAENGANMKEVQFDKIANGEFGVWSNVLQYLDARMYKISIRGSQYLLNCYVQVTY